MLPTESPARLEHPVRPRRGDDRPRGARGGARRSSPRARGSPSELGDERLVARMAINELMLDQFTGSGQLGTADRAREGRSSRSSSATTTTSRSPARGTRSTFRELTRGPVRGRDASSVGHAGRARAAGRQRAARRPGRAGRRVPHGPRRDARARRDPRLRRAARQHPRQPQDRGDRPRRARAAQGDGRRSSTRPARSAQRVADHPRRAPGADRRELHLDRGIPGRDPRRRPRGGRGDAAARRRGARGARRAVLPLVDRGHPRERPRAPRLFAEAERYAALAESLSDEEDLESQVSWRTARAKVLANTGRPRGGRARWPSRPSPRQRGRGRTGQGGRADGARAACSSMVGRRESSGPPLREALGLYEAKGDRSSLPARQRAPRGSRDGLRPAASLSYSAAASRCAGGRS